MPFEKREHMGLQKEKLTRQAAGKKACEAQISRRYLSSVSPFQDKDDGGEGKEQSDRGRRA